MYEIFVNSFDVLRNWKKRLECYSTRVILERTKIDFVKSMLLHKLKKITAKLLAVKYTASKQ